MNKEQKEFIITANTKGCLRGELAKVFPELFPTILKVGRWYRDEILTYKGLICITNLEAKKAYGFKWNSGSWKNANEGNWGFVNLVEVSESEVGARLSIEARRRGFIIGCTANNSKVHNTNYENFSFEGGGRFVYTAHSNTLVWETDEDAGLGEWCIFKKGVWADVITTITKADAEKVLGKIILN